MQGYTARYCLNVCAFNLLCNITVSFAELLSALQISCQALQFSCQFAIFLSVCNFPVGFAIFLSALQFSCRLCKFPVKLCNFPVSLQFSCQFAIFLSALQFSCRLCNFPVGFAIFLSLYCQKTCYFSAKLQSNSAKLTGRDCYATHLLYVVSCFENGPGHPGPVIHSVRTGPGLKTGRAGPGSGQARALLFTARPGPARALLFTASKLIQVIITTNIQ